MDREQYSTSDVAASIGVADSTICSWYRGDSLPFARNEEAIEKFLNGHSQPTQQDLPLTNGKVKVSRIEGCTDKYAIQDGNRMGIANVKWL